MQCKERIDTLRQPFARSDPCTSGAPQSTGEDQCSKSTKPNPVV